MSSLNLDDIWKPLPTQSEFLKAIAEATDGGQVGYVGSLGSGKSWVLCRAVIGLAFTNPGIRILVGRFLQTDLRDTTQAQFFEMIDMLEDRLRAHYTGLSKKSLLGEYSASRKEYQFREGGALCMFRPLEEADRKYRSLTLGSYGVDEASEVPLPAMLMLKARIRQAGVKRVGFVTSNPTSTRHWLYEWFVKDPNTGAPLPGHTLFRTNTSENSKNLPPDYIENLKRSYPEDWLRLYLMGEWGELRTGQRPVFPTFTVKDNVAETQWHTKLPILVGLDWGYRNPGVVWAQMTDRGQLLIHRCWFPREIHTYDLCHGILKRNGEWFPGAQFLYFAGWDGNKRNASSEKTDTEIFNEIFRPNRIKLVAGSIDRGLNIIRNLIDRRDDDAASGLLVNPVNERIIEGFLGGYHYAPTKGQVLSSADLTPVKEVPAEDGLFDPLMDAFRTIAVGMIDAPTAMPRRDVVYGYRRSNDTRRIRRSPFSSIPTSKKTILSYGV